MDDDASNNGSVWRVATIALGMIAVCACAYSFMLYSALSTDLAGARIDSELAHNEVVNLRTQLNSTEAQANTVHKELLSTRARLAAKSRRNLPIRLSFHDAGLRPGKVAVLRNSGDADLEVVLDVHSTVSGEHLRRPLVINAHGLLEIGAAQGWQFAPGQIVTVENDHYRPIVRIVS